MTKLFRAQRLWIQVAGLAMLCVIASMFLVYAMMIGLAAIGVIPPGELAETLQIGMPMAAAVPLFVSVPVCWTILSMADELAAAKAELQRLAATDHLTGLLNRRGFETAAETMISEAGADDGPFAALIFDIDHFKAINDTHGHAVGDAVIRCVTARLMTVLEQLGAADMCAGRVGGEEFAVIIRGFPIRPVLALAERVRAQCSAGPVIADGIEVPVTVSVGVALATRADVDLDGLIATADAGLYRAKREGRDRVAQAPAETQAA